MIFMEVRLRQVRIQEVSESVPQEIGAEDDEGDEEARRRGEPPGVGQVVAPLGKHETPGGTRSLDAHAEEAQYGLEQDHGGELASADLQDGRHVDRHSTETTCA